MRVSGRRSALVTIASASFSFSVVLLHSMDTQQASWPREWSSVHGSSKGLYTQSCSSCHTADLKGGDQLPPLAGETFLSHWQGRSVKDLFDRERPCHRRIREVSAIKSTSTLFLTYFRPIIFPQGRTTLDNSSELSRKMLMMGNR